MNRFSINVALLSVLAASTGICLVGCGEPAEESGSSYADLVSIYNTELQSLVLLQRQREDLVAKHTATLGPSTADAEKVLDALLSSANEAGQQINLEGVTDPNDLLDRAVEHAEKVQGVTSELLESVSTAAEPSADEVKKTAELTKQYELELAQLDKQIEAQKVRVDRALKARDAAEAAQK
jgi:hypothetical protein